VLIGIALFPLINLCTENLSMALTDYKTTETIEMMLLRPKPILSTLLMSILWKYCWVLGQDRRKFVSILKVILM
jgi:hypothetical protein